jgi:ribosomal protein S18 acetylase RimI-like enzyme
MGLWPMGSANSNIETDAAARQSKIQIEWLGNLQLPHAWKIETENSEYPWHPELIRDYLAQPHGLGKVAKHGSEIVGFILYEMLQDRIEIHHLIVTKDFIKQGVGSALIKKVMSKLAERLSNGTYREEIHCLVPDMLKPMHRLLSKLGFISRRIARNSIDYQGEQRDAYPFVFKRDYLQDLTFPQPSPQP